jgi:hypothetical protein
MTTVLTRSACSVISLTPTGLHDPLPGLLPVGCGEAARLAGPEPDGGMWMVGRLRPNRAGSA